MQHHLLNPDRKDDVKISFINISPNTEKPRKFVNRAALWEMLKKITPAKGKWYQRESFRIKRTEMVLDKFIYTLSLFKAEF